MILLFEKQTSGMQKIVKISTIQNKLAGKNKCVRSFVFEKLCFAWFLFKTTQGGSVMCERTLCSAPLNHSFDLIDYQMVER